MSTITIRPENFGKEAVLQIIESRKIIKGAEQEAERILEKIETDKENILKIAYNKGLLLGAEKATHSLHNSTQLNNFLKAKIQNIIIDLIKQVLIEIVNEDVNDNLKNKISVRVNKELEAYSKQLNLDETKISLEISNDIYDSEIEKIQETFPSLNILKKEELRPNTFILRSPYGEIESDPIAYIELVSSHLRNTLDLSFPDFINE